MNWEEWTTLCVDDGKLIDASGVVVGDAGFMVQESRQLNQNGDDEENNGEDDDDDDDSIGVPIDSDAYRMQRERFGLPLQSPGDDREEVGQEDEPKAKEEEEEEEKDDELDVAHSLQRDGDDDQSSGHVELINQVAMTVDQEDGSKYILDYRKVRNLFAGPLSSVKLYEKDGELFAFKCYRKCNLTRVERYKAVEGRMVAVTYLEKVQREINVLASLQRHTNICPLLQVLDGENVPKLYLVFPYYGGGHLMEFDHVRKIFHSPHYSDDGVIPAGPAIRYMLQVTRAVQHLHKQKFVHRDLKPANILVSQDLSHIVLSDFGCAMRLDNADGLITGTEGTYAFFSPEMCCGGEFNAYAADVWALGVTLYCMVFGLLPYDETGPKQLFDLIQDMETPVSLPKLEKVAQVLDSSSDAVYEALHNSELCDLIKKILVKDCKLRPTPTEIIQTIANSANLLETIN